MKAMTIIWVGVLLEIGLRAEDPLVTNDPATNLSRVPAAELPLAAAAMIKEAQPQDRNARATNVVKAAVRTNPAAAPLIVGTVARILPENSALASQAAAGERPELAAAITRAAVANAPAYAAEIVAAVCRIAPSEYRSIALAAASVARSASKEILRVVGYARADLKPFIDNELAACAGKIPSVGYCLDRAQMAASRAAALVAGGEVHGPISGAAPTLPWIPPQPLGPKPLRTGEPPSGGRNYARP
jgi:hypothetical protein